MLKMVFNDRELNNIVKRIGYTTNKHCLTRLKHLINKNILVVCFLCLLVAVSSSNKRIYEMRTLVSFFSFPPTFINLFK